MKAAILRDEEVRCTTWQSLPVVINDEKGNAPVGRSEG
ncbi:MAG: hypothetical protein ANABAC_1235 [Anaerolineae bacterium]|nr:MAG: hypothetical protein ANABAC_1235 [Anaerolineae bacterium]